MTSARGIIRPAPPARAFGRAVLAVCLCMAWLAPAAVAQSDGAGEFQRLEREAAAAYGAGDFAKFESIVRREINLQPSNFVPRYNLACALALQGRSDEAMAELVGAVERGFVDRRGMLADPSLGALRERADFRALVSNWARVLERHRDAVVAAARAQFPSARAEANDDRLRLTYLSAFDEKGFVQARAEVARIADWAGASVFTDLFDADLTANDPWVLVILPDRRDFMAWAVANFGPAALSSTSAIGGSYSHDNKRLVTQDLGSGLRHEFLHVLHWRDNARHGITHAIWVQEGLCSLVEDYDIAKGGALTPTISWRTNITKRLEKAGLMMPIEKFCALTRPQFMAARPLAMYAQARTLFLFLYQRGKLKEWYAAYNDTFAQDPTGLEAWKRAFPGSLDDLNRDYRAWVRALPAVPEEIAPGKASLGFDVESGSGDGPVIVDVIASRRDSTNLIKGDVITAIDGRPTRDLAELVRVLSDYEPGATVEISYRRGTRHASTGLTLVPRR